MSPLGQSLGLWQPSTGAHRLGHGGRDDPGPNRREGGFQDVLVGISRHLVEWANVLELARED